MLFAKPTSVQKLLTPEHVTRIVQAIEAAEQQTSGEVRVHLESSAKGVAPLDRAVAVFHELGLHKTAHRNGVLLYVALDDRQFAILGDEGIHARVGTDFWHREKDALAGYFSQGNIIGGIVYVIEQIGAKLRAHFPWQADDVNELSNDVSVGY